MAGTPGTYEEVTEQLTREFVGVHAPETVTRCVDAALHGAEEVIGEANPDLVERIARRHLQVLARAVAQDRP
jgi:hypothetical protein